jgi:hypothetical protein
MKNKLATMRFVRPYLKCTRCEIFVPIIVRTFRSNSKNSVYLHEAETSKPIEKDRKLYFYLSACLVLLNLHDTTPVIYVANFDVLFSRLRNM